jgi:hypothetical protein
MRGPLDRHLAAIFTACQDYYITNAGARARQERGEPYKQLQNALTSILRGMAEIHAGLYPDYCVDRRHVGYLIKFQPPMSLRVPYHVLPAFPTGEELEILWWLSRAIRSGDGSTISLSGSNVLRKIFDVVGDIDFCEYFPVSDENSFDKLASNMDGSEDIACIRLALADEEWHYPWGDDRPTKEYFAKTINSSDKARSTMKVDYVGDIDRFGVTEITNLVIAVDTNGKSAGLTKTFAAQEVPLVAIDWLPNQMNNPIEMGRYIDWLTNSIVAYGKQGDMQKCLKRCAPLSRILFVPEITEAIIDLAYDSPILLSRKASELERLSAMLEPLRDDRSLRLGALIKHKSKELAATLAERGGVPDDLARRRFDDEAFRIASKLLGYVRPGDNAIFRRAP